MTPILFALSGGKAAACAAIAADRKNPAKLSNRPRGVFYMIKITIFHQHPRTVRTGGP